MRICLLIGGRGSNACAIIKAIKCGELKAECVGVISHKRDAMGIEHVRALGVPVVIVDNRDYDNKPSFEGDLLQQILALDVDVIALAGFMRILSADFINELQNKVILNIHPSLLPKYPGLNTHQRVIDAGDKVHGATVHHVIAACDQGPIVMQAQIPVLGHESSYDLEERLLPVEHQLYIDALSHIQQTMFPKPNNNNIAGG